MGCEICHTEVSQNWKTTAIEHYMFFLPQKTLNGASYRDQQADVSDLSKMLFSRN